MGNQKQPYEGDKMTIGFGRSDITPRVGVELSGFGPFVMRRSESIRDRLWARAMAVEHGEQKVILASLDLVGIHREIAQRIRQIVGEATGLSAEAVMIHCTHTHSGPNTGGYIGWGAPDEPYLEILPQRVADACVRSLDNLQEAVLCHAEVPCQGIGQNREYDRDGLPLEEVLEEGWRPNKPELTDTTCHVVKAMADGKMIGFFSYFGCHPVVCCAQTTAIHGDFCGVATNQIEREHPGSVGLFLQGAQGDVNTCVVHKPKQESMRALDLIAGRYANSVREGLQQAEPIEVDAIRCALEDVTFPRKPFTFEKLQTMLAENEAILHAPDANDEDQGVRMAMVNTIALRQLILKKEAGESLEPATELHAIRLGPIAFLGSGFEIFQSTKNEICAETKSPLTLVMGLTNDTVGYAPDPTAAERGGYAADTVPLIVCALPHVNVHEEVIKRFVELEAKLH